MKKLFQRGIFPVFKDNKTSKKQLLQWIRLSLYFEKPEIRPGSLFLQSVPRWFENYETGVIAVGFGLHARSLAAIGRYWKHDWIVNAIIGKQTADFRSESPLIAQYKYEHITSEIVQETLNKYVGQIEQISLPKLALKHKHKADQINLLNNNLSDEHLVSEECFSLIHDSIEDENGGNHPTIREKNCHSIELLEMDDNKLQIRVQSDGIFSCRALVRDIGIELGCHAVVDSLQLNQVGPFTIDQALPKHELHLEQIEQSIAQHMNKCERYIDEMKQLYPSAKPNLRFI
ncbi:TruB pseudouridine (psi) synthase 1 [Blomia tropicalis]|nr:TruB pseudouridine (psi) synthase 1 [Blomia tropicalis]